MTGKTFLVCRGTRNPLAVVNHYMQGFEMIKSLSHNTVCVDTDIELLSMQYSMFISHSTLIQHHVFGFTVESSYVNDAGFLHTSVA